MVNSYFKHGILAVSVILLALSGCKKDKDNSSSFTITGDTSIHFNPGQTKKTEYSSRNIVSFKHDAPEGWDCNVANGVITVDAPTAESAKTITIKITATTTASTEITATIDVAVKIAEEFTEHANSYIATKANQRYKFDARIKGSENAGSMTPADGSLLWCTADGGISHVSIEEDGYLYFFTKDATSPVEANALVAALDNDGEVLWSWHIWVTDYDPAADFNELGGKKVMSRNLGALASANTTEDEVVKSYGLYYQWGRKDPFAGPKAWNSAIQQNLYNANSDKVAHSFAATTADVGTMSYATAHPATFIAGVKETNYDWLFTARNNDLWGGVSGKKTLNDPCPAGWMVASPDIWSGFTSTGESSEDESEFNIDGTYKYGWTFKDDNAELMFWPGAGRRSFSNLLASYNQNYQNVINGEFGEQGAPVGFYWSNKAAAAGSESHLLAFREDYVNPGADTHTKVEDYEGGWSPEGARAGGFPLRCAKIE